jgi:hypothetical protein
MSEAEMVSLRQPHAIVLEGQGLKRLVQVVVAHHGRAHSAITELSSITNLPLVEATILVNAELLDSGSISALDKAIWELLS